MEPVNTLPPELIQQAEEASQHIQRQAEQASAIMQDMAADLTPQATDLSRGEPLR